MIQRWEYDYFCHGDHAQFMTSLQKAGKKGWEVVNVMLTGAGQYIAYLKRRLRHQASEEDK